MGTFATDFKPLVRRVQVKEETLNRLIFDPPTKPVFPQFGRVALKSPTQVPVQGLDRLFYYALGYVQEAATADKPIGFGVLAEKVAAAERSQARYPKMLFTQHLVESRSPATDLIQLKVDLEYHFTDPADPEAVEAHGAALLKWVEVYEAVLELAAATDKLIKVPVETIIAEFSVIAATLTVKTLKIRYEYNSKRYATLTDALITERVDGAKTRVDVTALDHLLIDLRVVTDYINLFCKLHKL